MSNYNLELDIYKVFRLQPSASRAEIKKRYAKLLLRFHPDKINQREGREVNDEEKLTWADIQKSYDILGNENKNIIYDDYRKAGSCGRCYSVDSPCGRCCRARFFCPQCSGIIVGSQNKVEIWQTKPGVVRSTRNLRYFCSANCSANFNTEKGYTDNVHRYPENDNNTPPPPPPNPNSEKYCLGCKKERDIPRSEWVSFKEDSEKCCSDYCLYSLLKRQRKQCRVCQRCNKVYKWNDNSSDWRRKKNTNSFFCSAAHLKEYYSHYEGFGGLGTNDSGDPLLTDKNSSIAKIDNALTQDPPITNSELENSNQNWRNDIQNATTLSQITAIKNRVLADIQNKRNAKKGKTSDSLQALKNAAIAEIDSEILREPEIKVSELDSGNQNFQADIQGNNDENQIDAIKNRVLADIKHKRQAKKQGGEGQNLDNLRQEAINQIRAELKKNPPVDESEITNRNWEANIREVQTESAIKEIRDWALSDIKNKRDTKQEKNHLNELLIQAKQKENWDNYENLEAIFKQIKKLRSSNAYKEKESEILEAESRLRELSPDKFKETTEKLLDQQVKENWLDDSSMDNETREAINAAKQNPTPENVAKAEEKISQNVANNNLKKLINKVENKLKKGNLSEKEKTKIITEILQFITRNNYQAMSYKKQKDKVEKLLAELRRGEKPQDNTQSPSFWKKALAPLLIISLLGIMITSVLIWRRKRLKRKGGRKK